MNGLRSALSVFLAFVLVCSVFCVVSPEAKADSGYYKWSGYATYMKGEGTEESPFLISTPNELAYFRKQVAATDGKITYYLNDDTSSTAKTKDADDSFYRLVNDIYYNDPNGTEWQNWSETVKPANGGSSVHEWAPPGYGDESTRRFQGHFDGDGHTVYGLYISYPDKNCVGFIGSLRYGTIANLTLAKGFVCGANLVGGFVGQAKVGADIVNCRSQLTVKGANGVGGFVGGNPVNGSSLSVAVDVTTEGTVPSFAVYDCINHSNVSATTYAGGVAGFVISGTSRAQFVKCVNNGTVSVVTNCAGGIVGGTKYLDDYAHGYVEDCINYGKIQGGTGSYAGGIVGCGRATEIYSCVNYGDVSSNGANYTGGISGGCNSADGLANGKIFYCFNQGTVKGSSYTGGITGVSKSVNVNMCGNVGAVTGTTYVGGISGKGGGTSDGRDTEIYDCYNAGAVTSTNNSASVAGIVGEAFCEGTVSDNKYVKVKRCINVAKVTGGRGIANTTSTLSAADGTGLFVYQFADSCFALEGVNTNFDGGTAVSSMALDSVLSKLNAESADTWMAGYPYPTLNKIDYAAQGRSSMFGDVGVRVFSANALEISVPVNASDAYCKSISGFSAEYGVLVSESDALGESALTAQNAKAVCKGSCDNDTVKALFDNISVDEYDVCYTFRPYVRFTVENQKIYAYGSSVESTVYGAKDADKIEAVRKTAAFECDSKLFLLAGTKGEINHTLVSSGDTESISFISSNPSVATVAGGVVEGIRAGAADITVTYTGSWGVKTFNCTVTVMDDLTGSVSANQYADMDFKLRLHTNKLVQVHTSVTKNDCFVLDYNGTVAMIDGGYKNDAALEYLTELREEFIKEGFERGELSETDYHKMLLSSKCKLDVVSLITHWHSDHVYALRYSIAQSPLIRISDMYTLAAPSGTDADGYSSYVLAYDRMISALKTNSPDMNVVRSAYEKSTVLYMGDKGVVSAASSSVKLTMLSPKDWSVNSSLKTNSTAWVNCSSAWYVFEYGGNKLLFTGDTYPNDTGTTYTGVNTSGKTAVDYMLSKYKTVVDSSVTFLDCNHHSRSSYVENLFTVTQPSMVFSGVYYGHDNVKFTDKAVETADFYLGGDGEQMFVFGSDGAVDKSGAVCAYSQNKNGRAIRNHLPIHYENEIKPSSKSLSLTAPTGISLTASTLWVAAGETTVLKAVVGGGADADKNVVWTISDDSVLSTNGALLTAKRTGVVTVTARAGAYTKQCVVTVVLKGDTNNDGVVSTADCISLRMAIVNDSANEGLVVAAADFSMDGVITAVDYSSMKLYIKENG